MLKFKQAAIALGLFLTGCGTPLAPMQPAAGMLEDYDQYYKTPVINQLQVNPRANLNLYADGTIAIENVPTFKQGDDRTCAQAVTASVLNYWGVKTTYQNVINEANPNNMPTDTGSIADYLRKKGLKAQDYRMATMNFLKKQVNDGKPTPVLLDFGGLSNEHYILVIGYNDNYQEVVFNDSIDGPNLRMGYAEFEKKWQNAALGSLLIFGGKFRQAAVDVSR